MEEYWRSLQFFPFPLLRTTLVFKRGRWSQESPGLRRSASSCWACFCWVHLRGLEIVCHCITQAIKKEEELSIAASKLEVRRLKEPLWASLFPSQTIDCPSEFVSLVVQDGRWEKEDADAEINRGTSMSTSYWYCLVLCHILSFDIWFWMAFLLTVGADVWLQGLIAMAFCSPASRTLSSREFWCPASFVEPLWSSLLAEAICISLQGSRSIVSPHVRTCWSNPSRCGRSLVPAVFWALKTEHPSSKNMFASTAGVVSAGTVFFELVNGLFSSCATI